MDIDFKVTTQGDILSGCFSIKSDNLDVVYSVVGPKSSVDVWVALLASYTQDFYKMLQNQGAIAEDV